MTVLATRAGSAAAARPADQRAGGGATPTSALHDLRVGPIPIVIAKRLIERHHYLHSLPGGTQLAFGVFGDARLQGAVTLGVGPANAHRLVEGAQRRDCLGLSRVWLANDLPKNSESKTIAIVLRALRSHTAVKFVLSYADPAQGHVGTVYQAGGWAYVGFSQATPRIDLGDGRQRFTRTLGHALGTHSIRHLRERGIDARLVPQAAKHRYITFIDPTWRERLRVPVLPYPKRLTEQEAA